MKMSKYPSLLPHGEQRLYPRYSVELPLEIQFEGASAPLQLKTCNISLCGCCVMPAEQFPVGVSARLALFLGEDQITIKGRVITRHPQFGNGIMFLRFDGSGEERLRAFLNALTPEPAIRP